MQPIAQKQNRPQQPVSSSLARSNTFNTGENHHAHHILQLQRTIGNRAVQKLLQAKTETTQVDDREALPPVNELLRSSGQPLNRSLQATLEQRFDHDFNRTRVYTNAREAESARASNAVQRYGPIPPVDSPTVLTMRDFIDLVRRIEAANSGLTALQTAEMIRRTKYNSIAWGQLLPHDIAPGPVTARRGVTEGDVTTLSGEFTVTLPQGGQSDPTHIVAAIEAAFEARPADWPTPPPGLSQSDVASWAGDVGSAAGEWVTGHPLPAGGTNKQSYMQEFAPESDLIADVDGVAMTSRSASTGFAIDLNRPLSENLEQFYYPAAPREGKNRRFHIFCSVVGLPLEADQISLSSTAINTINYHVRAFTSFYITYDPDINVWRTLHPIRSLACITQRSRDWRWFAGQFCQFLQRNLRAEGG